MKLLYTFIVALVGIFLDQAHKYYMINYYKIQFKSPIMVNDFLNFVMVWNKGISFGMFNGFEYANYFFIIFSCCIVTFLIYLASKSENNFELFSVSLIISGAVGNIIDRINYGAVADFFDFHINDYHWPAFNIADALIFCGAFLFIISNLLKKMSKNLTKLSLTVIISSLVCSCTITGGEMRRSVGLNKDAPDEFMITTRKKLEIPGDMSLPVPGSVTEASKQEASIEARQELFGITEEKPKELSSIETALLGKTDKYESNSAIRGKLKKEAKDYNDDSVVDSIVDPFGFNRGDDHIIDAEKENLRIRKAISEGKKITPEKAKIVDKYNISN